jgi:hypothetical protein
VAKPKTDEVATWPVVAVTASPCAGIRFVDLGDLPRLALADRVSFTWPPPATETTWSLGHGIRVCGQPGDSPGHWYVAPLQTIIDSTDLPLSVIDALLDRVVPAWATWSTVAQWPQIYSVPDPDESGPAMRWQRVTFRGELGGGVEQFQHKIDFGNPGADPDIDQAEAATIAETLAGLFVTEWAAQHGSALAINNWYGPGVHYTEIGVVEMNLGSGDGDPTQSFPTQWYLYPLASQPKGIAGVTLPFEVSCAVTLQTDFRGASGRGRTYLPPFVTGTVEGNTGLSTPRPSPSLPGPGSAV